MEVNVEQILQKEYENLINIYGEDRILGIFSIGNANYGFLDSEKELSFIGIYIPTFNDLCVTRPITASINNKTTLIDIRKMYYAGSDPSWTSLELLFAQYFIINTKYEKIFNKMFIKNRESIAHINNHNRIFKARCRMESAFNENDFEAYRLYYGAVNFIDGGLCEDSYYIKNKPTIELLRQLKDGAFGLSQTQKENMKSYMDDYLSTTKNEINKIGETAVRRGVLAIMDRALAHNTSEESVMENFTKNCTAREIQCFDYILKALNNDSGIISIATLENESEYSKTILRAVLGKMEKYNVADIQSRGRKGTEINFKIAL